MKYYRNKKRRNTILILVVLAIGIAIFAYLAVTGMGNKFFSDIINKDTQNNIKSDESKLQEEKVVEDNYKDIPIGFDNYVLQPKINWSFYKDDVKVKGIYVSAWTAGTEKSLNYLLKLINDTELNAMVIDIKTDGGRLTYNSQLPGMSDICVDALGDLKPLLARLKKERVFPIARIVCFKDQVAGKRNPELAIKNKNGVLWRDRKGNTWLNPFNKESWDYIVDISKEVANLGFKEIQYDYVRFPTDGDVRTIDYGDAIKTQTKADAIGGFLKYAKQQLSQIDVDVSADVFGIVPLVPGDLEGIGQDWDVMGKDIDYMCPMVYPSHYANIRQNGVGQRINGVLYQRPDLEPYGVIYNTMVVANDRLANKGDNAKVRPYIQAFTASYLHQGCYQIYGGKQIRDQIKAVYDAGSEEWILWDATNNYTTKGLLKE